MKRQIIDTKEIAKTIELNKWNYSSGTIVAYKTKNDIAILVKSERTCLYGFRYLKDILYDTSLRFESPHASESIQMAIYNTQNNRKIFTFDFPSEFYKWASE